MEIILPKVAPTMTSGVIAEWHVSVGQAVNKGDPLFTFETDKTAIDVEAPANGVITSITAEPGDEVAAGTPVAELAVEGEHPAAGSPRATAEASVAPAAAALANILGVGLAAIRGSGTGGRIVEADVIAASQLQPPPGRRDSDAAGAAGGTAAGSSEPRGSAGAPTHRAETAPLVFSAARRASWATLERSAAVPTFQLGGSLAIGRLDVIRAVGVSLLDVVALAAARTLPDHPTCHARVHAGAPETFTAPRIGILVRLEDALYAPSFAVSADDTAAAFGRRRREAQQRLAEGRLPAANSSTPTFAISNLGAYGVDWFTAMLYPDTAVTLAMGAMGAGARAENEIGVVLTCDHRLADGVDAARFLADLRDVVDTIPLE